MKGQAFGLGSGVGNAKLLLLHVKTSSLFLRLNIKVACFLFSYLLCSTLVVTVNSHFQNSICQNLPEEIYNDRGSIPQEDPNSEMKH